MSNIMRHIQEHDCGVVVEVRTRLNDYELLVMENH
jgi:hypothetical protein